VADNGSRATPADGRAVAPGGLDSVWARVAGALGSAGFVELPAPAGGLPALVELPPARGKLPGPRQSAGRWVEWGRRQGLPEEFLERVARIGQACGWGE
jgi:hypothetical protein